MPNTAEWSVDRFKRDRPTVDTKAADDTLLPHPGTTAAPSVIASPVDDSARPEPSTSQSKLLGEYASPFSALTLM
jgi:hypothetical protein